MTVPSRSFQLFPSPPIHPVPKIALPDPQSRRPSVSKSPVSPAETVVKSENGESVIVKIEEVEEGRPMSAGIGIAKSIHPSQDADPSMMPANLLDGHSHGLALNPPTPPNTPPKTSKVHRYIPKEIQVHKRVPSPPASMRSDTATLVHNHSQVSRTASPVAPIRSMFPVYNPTIPLSQQAYYPQRTTSLEARLVQRDSYASRVATPSQLDNLIGGPRTAPASVINFPLDATNSPDVRYSSAKDLEKLWEASHGMEANVTIGTFDVEMARTDEATFVFGSSPTTPFYTLTTYNTNELSISKTSPRKRGARCEILQTSIESPERHLPPNDGLVTLIFPKLAAMLAIDQSTELAKEHNLAPTHKDEVIAAAVERASNQEACRLFWNVTDQRYELEHPAIGRNAQTPEFVLSPLSPRPDAKPSLHITVSTHGICSPMTSSKAPPVILVTDPNTLPSPSNSAAAGIRLSTIPQSDNNNPLASLDFGNMTLHIDANQILKLMPSLFAIDSIVSAVLAVAVADPTTNPAMATMDVWSPSPKVAASVFGGSVKSYRGSTFFATIAEREEAEEEAKLMKLMHDKDVKSKDKTGKDKRWFESRKEKEAKKTAVTIAEFDLEKLGHYQAGSRKGEELPVVTRGVLSALISGLKMVVWLLTAFVQMLIWLLVSVSRAVTSEKF